MDEKHHSILNAVKLSPADAHDFVQKHAAYLNSLNPAQYAAVKKSLPSWKQAAASLGPGVTAQDLQNFVKERGGPANAAGALCFLACTRAENDE